MPVIKCTFNILFHKHSQSPCFFSLLRWVIPMNPSRPTKKKEYLYDINTGLKSKLKRMSVMHSIYFATISKLFEDS